MEYHETYGGFLKSWGIPKSPWVSILNWSILDDLVVPPLLGNLHIVNPANLNLVSRFMTNKVKTG
jgi:hypothetical protein